MRPNRPHLVALAPLALLISGAALALQQGAAGVARPSLADAPPVRCNCELRSWVVAGRGRHLLLEIDCPAPLDDLDGVVEFTSAALREDYDPARDPSGAPRVASMTRGVRLQPFLNRVGAPEERIEARWTVDADAARCLLRDRLFESRYALLGPNSNSAMAGALASCGLALPDGVLAGAGILGEFPGVDFDPGPEVPADRWGEFGLPFARP